MDVDISKNRRFLFIVGPWLSLVIKRVKQKSCVFLTRFFVFFLKTLLDPSYPRAKGWFAKVSQNTCFPKARVAKVSQNMWYPEAGVAETS